MQLEVNSEKMYLLDTNHCSAILAGDRNIAKKLESGVHMKIVTCDIVMGELIYMAKYSARTEENTLRINNFLNGLTILSGSQAAARIYGDIKTRLMKQYGPRNQEKKRTFKFKQIGISDNDLWIASIGLAHNCIILTQDGDFNRINDVYSLAKESWI